MLLAVDSLRGGLAEGNRIEMPILDTQGRSFDPLEGDVAPVTPKFQKTRRNPPFSPTAFGGTFHTVVFGYVFAKERGEHSMRGPLPSS